MSDNSRIQRLGTELDATVRSLHALRDAVVRQHILTVNLQIALTDANQHMRDLQTVLTQATDEIERAN